ncbi:MAG: hypothetical protein M3063_10150, partial [Actinomycetota bacterium]|nr:hypothetical protein [Actinomycetota bacterium]
MRERKKKRNEGSEDRRSPEGVRIIRADEAEEALDTGQAAGRRPEGELRFGDVPPAPEGPRSAHRFPLPDTVDPAAAVPRRPLATPRRAPRDRPVGRRRTARIDPDAAHDPRPWDERVPVIAAPPAADFFVDDLVAQVEADPTTVGGDPAAYEVEGGVGEQPPAVSATAEEAAQSWPSTQDGYDSGVAHHVMAEQPFHDLGEPGYEPHQQGYERPGHDPQAGYQKGGWDPDPEPAPQSHGQPGDPPVAHAQGWEPSAAWRQWQEPSEALRPEWPATAPEVSGSDVWPVAEESPVGATGTAGGGWPQVGEQPGEHQGATYQPGDVAHPASDWP